MKESKWYLVNERKVDPVKDLMDLMETIERMRSIPPPPYQVFPVCSKCGDLVEPDQIKNNLCKRCYIRKYGEWRRI